MNTSSICPTQKHKSSVDQKNLPERVSLLPVHLHCVSFNSVCLLTQPKQVIKTKTTQSEPKSTL